MKRLINLTIFVIYLIAFTVYADELLPKVMFHNKVMIENEIREAQNQRNINKDINDHEVETYFKAKQEFWEELNSCFSNTEQAINDCFTFKVTDLAKKGSFIAEYYLAKSLENQGHLDEALTLYKKSFDNPIAPNIYKREIEFIIDRLEDKIYNRRKTDKASILIPIHVEQQLYLELANPPKGFYKLESNQEKNKLEFFPNNNKDKSESITVKHTTMSKDMVPENEKLGSFSKDIKAEFSQNCSSVVEEKIEKHVDYNIISIGMNCQLNNRKQMVFIRQYISQLENQYLITTITYSKVNQQNKPERQFLDDLKKFMDSFAIFTTNRTQEEITGHKL